ncbi:hypothetical protein H5410_041825, partial [Solanum commersonii]
MLQLEKKGVDQSVQQKKIVLLSEQELLEWVYYTQSGATIINVNYLYAFEQHGMLSERFRNVKFSTFVTGDLGYKTASDVKWKENK